MHTQILYGVAFIAAGIGGIWYDRWLRKRGTHTTGSIVDVECEYDPRPSSEGGGTKYHAVLEFCAASGWDVRAVCRQSTSMEPRIGKQVPVLYDPENHHSARIDTVFGRGTWIAGAALGIGFYLIVANFIPAG